MPPPPETRSPCVSLLFLLMTLMTPFTALAPHSAAPGPLMTSIRSMSARGTSCTSQNTPEKSGVYTVRPSISTRSLLAVVLLNPRALMAHWRESTCATWRLVARRRTSGRLEAPERRMSSCVMTWMAEAACASLSGRFETEVTSTFMSCSMLSFLSESADRLESGCWATPGSTQQARNAKRIHVPAATALVPAIGRCPLPVTSAFDRTDTTCHSAGGKSRRDRGNALESRASPLGCHPGTRAPSSWGRASPHPQNGGIMAAPVASRDSDLEGRSEILKVAAASLIGTSIEWYDFFLYGTAAALVFNKLFFPTFAPLAGTMAAFATYAVGFAARPIGGIVFGHYGDKLGRKTMLYLTLLIMGLATTAIGLLPTYASIGIWAPILLVAMRLLQGLGIGGEWGGAVLMAIEHAPAHRRGFYGSWPQMGVAIGLLLSTLAFRHFSGYPEATFLAWAWRVPFLLSFILLAVGLWIRHRLAESPVFQRLKGRKGEARMPVIEVFRGHMRPMLLATGARLAENGLFYIFTTFSLTYVASQLKLDRNIALNGLLVASACSLITVPAWGAISDRIGRRPVYLLGAVAGGVLAFPFFWLLETGQAGLIWLALVLAMTIGHDAMYAAQSSFFAELFPTRVRYSGASLASQLGSVFSGGLSPLIATALLARTGGKSWPVSLYMVGLVLLPGVSVWVSRGTHKQAIDD